MASNITDVRMEPLTSSIYIRPFRFFFKQNGIERQWDLMCCHDAVMTLLYHKERRALVFVKQFRPPVYLSRIPSNEKNGDYNSIDWSKYSSSLGYTLELCAGIVDKNKSLAEIAQEEVVEECGYSIPLSKMERITSYRFGVGESGGLATMFYAEIDDSMKVSEGGGNVDESEQIELEYIPVEDAKRRILYDENLQRPSGVLFGVMWFFENKFPTLAT